MGAYGGEAARWAGIADRMASSLAREVVQEQVEAFAVIEYAITPKRSGKLAGSEHIDSIGGGGAHAEATYSPHVIYAAFRENGGTITAKGGLGRKGMRPHTLHFGGVFPLSVTQAGSHYVERSEAAARGEMNGIAEMVLEEFLGG